MRTKRQCVNSHGITSKRHDASRRISSRGQSTARIDTWRHRAVQRETPGRDKKSAFETPA